MTEQLEARIKELETLVLFLLSRTYITGEMTNKERNTLKLFCEASCEEVWNDDFNSAIKRKRWEDKP